jgi:hypothetical protein
MRRKWRLVKKEERTEKYVVIGKLRASFGCPALKCLPISDRGCAHLTGVAVTCILRHHTMFRKISQPCMRWLCFAVKVSLFKSHSSSERENSSRVMIFGLVDTKPSDFAQSFIYDFFGDWHHRVKRWHLITSQSQVLDTAWNQLIEIYNIDWSYIRLKRLSKRRLSDAMGSEKPRFWSVVKLVLTMDRMPLYHFATTDLPRDTIAP